MTVWLWVFVGVGAYLALSVLVTLGLCLVLGHLRRGEEGVAASKSATPLRAEGEKTAFEWASAPLARERRRSSRACDLAEPRDVFRDALRRRDANAATAASKEMGGLDLGEALALCVVLAEREPTRYRLAAARWLNRFVEESADVSAEEAQLVHSALAALPSAPLLARPVLRELVRARHLVTVPGVLEDEMRIAAV